MEFTTATVSSDTGCLQWFGKRTTQQVLFFFLFALLPGSLWAATFYVDASNPNAGDGSSGNPWQKVSSVNNQSSTFFNPGDEILFKRGETWHESLDIPSSGTASQPILFGAYGSGDPPLFDGATRVTSWTSMGGGIYTAPWSGSDPGLLIYNGVAKPSITTLQFGSVPAALKKGAILLQKDAHYTNLWVTSTNENTVSGITFFTLYPDENVYVRQLNASGKEETWSSSLGHPMITTSLASLTEPGHWYWKNNAVYLYSAADPNTLDVRIGQLVTGIYSNGKDFLKIQDIAVQGYTGLGVHLYGTRSAVVQNMQVSNIGAASHQTGILINNSTDNIVKNNRVESVLRVGIGIFAGYDPPKDSHGNNVIGNTVLNSGSAGIGLNTDRPGDASLVQNNIIDGNTIDNANALSYDAAGIYSLFIGTDNIIENNIIRNGGSKQLRSAGIMVDQGVSPIEISYNTIDNNSLGGIVVTGTGHNIHHNIVRNNGVSSWECAQIVFFPVTENASACTVSNNTLEARGNRKLFLVLRKSGFIPAESPHNIDKNKYSSEETNTFCWSNDWQCAGWVDFNSWKNTSGQDNNSSFSLITVPPPSPPPSGKSITGVYLLLK